MANEQTDPNLLNQALHEALARLEGANTDKNLKNLVDQVMGVLKTSTVTNRQVFEQLTNLANYIANTRAEIAAIQAETIQGEHIPNATDQLDEVVSATEDATNKIMDCCDHISTIAGEVAGENGTKLMDEVTKIYEACNFQDLTGQRITKVVRTLKHIESQIQTLTQSLEQVGFSFKKGSGERIQVSQAEDPDKHLLNGPQAENVAIKQDDIDKLFG